jgi:hypothetical protein
MTARPRVLYVLPPIPDDLDDATKDALAVRNACTTEGHCPACGCKGELTGPDEQGTYTLTFRHESDCIAQLDHGGGS